MSQEDTRDRRRSRLRAGASRVRDTLRAIAAARAEVAERRRMPVLTPGPLVVAPSGRGPTGMSAVDGALTGAPLDARDDQAAPAGDDTVAAGNRAPVPAGSTAVSDLDLEAAVDDRFGRPGRAFNRQHPFFVGFVGAAGVFVAYGLVQALSALTTVLTLLVISLFLALGLEPLVEGARRRGLPRGLAIAAVFLGVVAVTVAFGSAVVPVLVAQGGELATQVPTYFAQLQESQWFIRLDNRYDVVSRFTTELQSRLTDGETAGVLFGGVLGAGAAVVGGVFNALTVLVLTLYFLASMRTLRATAYRLVPRSRRHRVALLGDEISRRIGGYVIGQIAIASLNGILTYVVLVIVGVPYPALLAIVVGLFGLIPLVGASIGAVIVVVVALFGSVTDAVVVGVYYVIYQQVENYLISPRVMKRAVDVPGALAVVAALAGGSLLGVLGALIAIPFAAGILLIVQQVVVPRQDRH